MNTNTTAMRLTDAPMSGQEAGNAELLATVALRIGARGVAVSRPGKYTRPVTREIRVAGIYGDRVSLDTREMRQRARWRHHAAAASLADAEPTL